MTRFGLRITAAVCMAALTVAGAEAQSTQKKETVPKGPSMASTTQLRGTHCRGAELAHRQDGSERRLSPLRRQAWRGGHD